MLRKKDQGVEWLEFELFAEESRLKHAIFLRHGGFSQPPYSALNLGGGSGDDTASITKNREKISRLLRVKGMISSHQVHGCEIGHVTDSSFEGHCDALVTAEKGIGLMIKHADCQAAIFYDPIQNVLANVHAGWRGSVENIYAKTIDFLRERYGSRPENLLVGISPSLGPEWAEFIHFRKELPESFWGFQSKPTYFDFWAISRAQLEEAGVLQGHIQVAGLCTYTEVRDFFSYRRDKVTGRNATVAMLN
ncbi:MAG: peptidoglycan editing factor PgeF [Chlamydiales bacterium]